MKLYDLCIVIGHSVSEWNNKYAIPIEDFLPKGFVVELWTFDKENSSSMTSMFTENLRLATKEEEEEFQSKFRKYCADYGNPIP